MNNDNAREATAVVTGLGLVCFALFAGVSLYTHSPNDVMDYHASESAEIANKAGLLGAKIAHHAFCMYGVGAWVITLLMLVFGAVMCATKSASGIISRSIGAALLVVVVSAWYGALKRPANFSEIHPAGPGGLLGGTFIAPVLINYFGDLCVFLVLGVASVIACMLIAQSLTESILALVGRGVVRGGVLLTDFVLGRVQNALPGNQNQPAMALSGGPPSARMQRPESLKNDVLPVDNARIEVVNPPDTRKRAILSELAGRNVADAKEAKEVKEPREKKAPETALRGLPPIVESVDDDEVVEKPKAKRLPKVETPDTSEADETERRRVEALRQADAAEADRLEREKQAKEQNQREMKALEKLEKERAAKDLERAKQQEKFAAAMAEAAANAPQEEQADNSPPPPQQPKLFVNYDLPKYDVLIDHDITPTITSDTLKNRGATVIQTLWDFKIGAKLAGIQSGPTVTMYELELDPGIKVQKVVGLQDNLAMAMKAENGVRIIAPIPGRATVGIEIPNTEDHTVRMRPILESAQFRGKSWTLPLVLGRDAVGNPLVADLAKMPHLLIAGTTGSGKSVCVNSIILSIMILRRPDEVKLILVDPKQVEMTDFKGIPHLMTKVVTDMKLAAGVLTWAVQKMEHRYERMSKCGVRNIASFNAMTVEERLARLPQDEDPADYTSPMPYIVIIVDEFADLMMTSGKEIEQAIARLAQKARAAGLHVILATQRPSADVVTGLIKTNLPCRICFQVKSKIDSRIVLDQGGADKLAGKGDMLFIGAGNSNLVRAKGVYISDEEIRGVVGFCKNQAEPDYSEEVERVAAQVAQGEDGDDLPETNRQAVELDDKFDEAVEVFLSQGRASTSLLQRRMGLGYTRAAKLCDQMEARGIVGPDRGAKGRELLITMDNWNIFKRSRANNNGSAFGPMGSKDNPGPAAASSVTGAAIAGDPGTRPGEDLNPALLAQLDNVDGIKDSDDEEDDE
jgi:S-DNA-T family DNA segregation ATPase FtsK/SpoIIIE